jgi:hypothetical protein
MTLTSSNGGETFSSGDTIMTQGTTTFSPSDEFFYGTNPDYVPPRREEPRKKKRRGYDHSFFSRKKRRR